MDSMKKNSLQGILFVFLKNGKILCEKRNMPDVPEYTIPGGRCEPEDFSSENFVEHALCREIQEELAIVVNSYRYLGQYFYKNYLFHACLIEKWAGEFPPYILDTQSAQLIVIE